MSGSFADRLQCRRFPLALALCLLAFLFAVEAKTAWYGPPDGPGSYVQSAKALPAVTPKLVGHHAPTPDLLHPGTNLSALLPATATALPAAHSSQPTRVFSNQLAFFTATFLSPPHFFRPPPAL